MTNLTEQWKRGKLPDGDYYIKRRNGSTLYDNIDSNGVWRNSIDEDIIEVLAEVPSYDGYMTLIRAYNEVVDENAELKELLKKAKGSITYRAVRESSSEKADKLIEEIKQIDELLGEE